MNKDKIFSGLSDSTKGFSKIIFVSLVTTFATSTAALENKVHKFGGTDVTALITTALGYGDNVFRGSINEESSGVLSVSPTLEAVRETEEQKLSLIYEGNGSVFFDSSDDNFFSNRVAADYVRALNSISEFSLGAAYEDGSTIRGVDITEGSNGEIEGATDFSRQDLSVGYALGSQKIGPSLELSYQYTDLEFDNFLIINTGRDYTLDAISARLGYQYSVATKFFVDLGYKDFDYSEALSFLGAELDNTEQSVHAGVKWRMGKLTIGEVSVGVTDKEFDSFSDPSTLVTWNLNFEWTPTSRDKVTLSGFSRPFEQAGSGIFQEVNQVTVAWLHDFSSRFNLATGFTYGRVDFDTTSRIDDFSSFNMGLIYNSSKYSEWSLNYEYEDKESELSQFDFSANKVFVSYALSF